MPRPTVLFRLPRCYFLIGGLMFFSCLNANESVAQVTGAYGKVYRSLAKFSEKAVQTKVYLHMDKDLYAAGESLWFKAYITSEPQGFLDTLSSTLYVELLDASSRVVQRQTIYLSTGLGNGSLEIDPDLISGLYYLRAYTSWMRNFDQEFFFLRPIEIQNTQQELPSYQPTITDKGIDLQFFPEGGDWLAGIRTRLAYKAIDANGRGVDIEATIYDANEDSVARIRSTHSGMGDLNFTPEPKQYYYARIAGMDRKYDLPLIKTSGYQMRTDNSYDNVLSIRVSALGKEGEKSPFLVVQAGGAIYTYVSKIAFDNKNEALISVPKKHLPSGINHITLFNHEGLPECERLVFINKADQLKIDLNGAMESYGKRELVTLDINATDFQGKPVVGSFSLAVVDANYRDVNRFGGNILSELLLTSDLKGHIEDPLQYFDAENPRSTEDLDLLMLTQGWRRFTWKDILSDPVPELKYSTEEGLVITGKAFYKNKKQQAVAGGKVSYFNFDDGLNEGAITETDAEGNFSFNGMRFAKGSGASIKAVDKRGRENIMLQVEQPLFNTEKLPLKGLDWLYYPQISEDGDSVVNEPAFVIPGNYRDLGSVTVTGARARGAVANKIPKSEYGSRVFDVDELLESTSGARSILDLLVGRLPSLSVIRTGSDPDALTVRDTRGQRRLSNAFTSGEPLYVLDGQPIEQSMAANIPVNLIATLEVLIGPPASLFGVRGMNGVIVMTSKEGVDAFVGPPLLGMVKLSDFGYDYSKEFYSPQYHVEDDRHKAPDKRSLLYWAPNIITDAEGRAQVSFYTGDLEGTYLIDLQGLGVNGKVGANKPQTIGVK